jgi:alpha-tubulin suppressor-like RCC1 family protein
MAILRTITHWVGGSCLGLAVVACDRELPVESLRSISVSIAGQWQDTLVVRDTTTFAISITDDEQRSLKLRNVRWESSDERILTVQPLSPSVGTSAADSLGTRLSAVVTARARGRAQITVSAEHDGVGRAEPFTFGITVLEQWVAVSAGGTFTCGLTVDLDAFCWGGAMSNRWSGLGIGNAGSSGSAVPVPVFGGIKFTSISAGDVHACGVSTAGLVYCWGHNGGGALGDGSFANSLIPIVVTAAQRATSVSAGTEITCLTSNPASAAYLQQNTFCWGLGEIRGRNPGTPVTCVVPARFGAGNCYPRPTEAAQSGDIGSDPDRSAMPLRDVSAGAFHACAIHESNNNVFCWGQNNFGQRALPIGVAPVWAMPALGPLMTRFRAIAVSATTRHTCAIGVDSLAYCWGDNSHGQAGTGTVSAPIAITTRVASDVKFQSISTSSGRVGDGPTSLIGAHTCAVAVTARLYCWGSNLSGAVGRISGDLRRPDTIVTPVGGPVRWKKVTTGGGVVIGEIAGPHATAHTCGLTDRGAIYCWGATEAGKLGIGGNINNPAAPPAAPTRVVEP